MITQEQALAWIRDSTPEQLKQRTQDRLLGREIASVSPGTDFESSEEILIHLLRDESIEPSLREAIIAGCRIVYRKINAWMIETEGQDASKDWKEILIRLSAVIDAAGVEELRLQAYSLVVLAKETFEDDSQVLGAAVRALMGLEPKKEYIPLWNDLIQVPSVAAYSLVALVDIDPFLPELRNHLVMLWKKQIGEAWPVDSVYLLWHVADERGSEDIVREVLGELRKDEVWGGVRSALNQQDWSREWLAELGAESKQLAANP